MAWLVWPWLEVRVAVVVPSMVVSGGSRAPGGRLVVLSVSDRGLDGVRGSVQ